jgi:threonine dehydrogenase-like Zn-dependent dehydrogenase
LRKHWRLSTVPDGLSTLDAATCEPLAVAIHAARISGVALGDTVAVIGLGAIGLFVVQCLKLQGAQRIIAVDPIASRRSTALALGATDIIDPSTVDALDAIVLASGGDGPDCVVECAGAKDTLEVAVQSVRQNGTVVLLACRFVDTPIVPANWLSREPRIVGSYAYGPHGWPMAKQLLASGRVTTKGITSDRHVFPFERIQEALDRCVSRGEDVVKAILTFA